ncbi:unnamed protein product [Microthlaspi erraticum]|uniref:PCI domain-containing protein n=1 Tax=Microthlaspi erraticum TaxID=1685480 RepID=A0A6D2IR65_9BRAS|nr:unnamed protein product [Microthlaspi erraticum]
MFKHMDLCVDLKSGRFAKDGLIQYRIICQHVNVSSLEEVIKHFLNLATEKAEKTEALAEALDVFDDELEADVKFLWETYRTVLEVLRHSSKLEELYAMTAQKALQFCKKHKRPTEFRRLCEIIRNHNRYRDQRERSDLSSPESFQLCLDTRFELLLSLDSGRKLFVLLKIHLYHAYAWFKLFILQSKYLSKKDLQLLASSLALAALSIPLFENEKEEDDLRMASLIGSDLEPKLDMLSRPGLVSELVSRGVLRCASQEVQDVFNVLEDEIYSLDLDLGSRIQPLLEKISKSGGKLSSVPQVQLSQYVPCLEKLATLRLLQQVSKVYQTISIESLSQLVPFFEFSVVEKIAVDAFVAMKVDHMKGVVTFGSLDIECDGVKDDLDFLLSL